MDSSYYSYPQNGNDREHHTYVNAQTVTGLLKKSADKYKNPDYA
jgi:hypothetical protein